MQIIKLKTRHFSLLIALFIFMPLHAQVLDWVKQMGGTGGDGGGPLQVDASGNVILAGTFTGTADFDPGPEQFFLTSELSDDIFITKLNPSGDLVWAGQIGGDAGSIIHSLTLDAQGNIYGTGVFGGAYDFDPGPEEFILSSTGGWNAFVFKLDSGGNFVWAKHFGNSLNMGWSIALDDSGNIYVTGNFVGPVDFDPGPGEFYLDHESIYDNIFITKLDADGNLVWARQFKGELPKLCFSIAIDTSGYIFTLGYIMGTTDFDPGPGVFNLTPIGARDIFISKLDADGNFVWARQMGGDSYASGRSLVLDAANNMYFTGVFSGAVDFDPGPGSFTLVSVGAQDAFICKLDAGGNFGWAKQIGGALGDSGISLALDQSGNVYASGHFRDTVDFDPGPGVFNLVSEGNSDIFICNLDSGGNFRWARRMGGPEEDAVRGLIIDSFYNIYTSGWFRDVVDFDPGDSTLLLSSFGEADVFVQKMYPCINDTTIIFASPCVGFIFNGEVYTESGVYTQVFADADGCESVFTLHLDIYTVDTAIVQDGTTLIAQASDGTFQWVDCATGEGIPGATGVSFTPTEYGVYAVVVTQGECSAMSGCYEVVIVSAGEAEAAPEEARIFPNPTKGRFTLSLPWEAEARLHDAAGRLVWSGRFEAGEREVDMEQWPAGLYLLTVDNQKTIQSFRVVKE
jgi:hypothetical protein